ncbi:MAG: type II secretion system F family protein [Beijerinckiaceae bacterium]|nr:type II secretion system F family protein [Beijerinckiaceae bacterium]
MDVNQLLVAVLAFVAVGGLGVAFLEPLLTGANRAEKRQAALADPRSRRKAVEDASNRRKQIADTLKELEQRQQAQKLTFEQRCEQAGVTWTKKTFIFISIGCALGIGLVVLLITKQPILALGGLFVGAFGLPRWILTRMAKKRQKLFMEEFPNAIDAIVRGIRSGLPLNDCLRLIALEAKEPLKSEFRGVVEAQAMGVSIADGIMKIFERIPLAEVNFFGIVIQIQAKSGGNLGEILSNLSRVIRDRKKLREKVDAMSTEAKASATIIGALPFLVGFLVYMGNPAYIELLWTTKAGQIGLGACFLIMGFGILVMKKMINFDI